MLQLSRIAYNTFESLEYNPFKRMLTRMRYGKDGYSLTLKQAKTQYIEAAGAEYTERKTIHYLRETLRRANDMVKYFSNLVLHRFNGIISLQKHVLYDQKAAITLKITQLNDYQSCLQQLYDLVFDGPNLRHHYRYEPFDVPLHAITEYPEKDMVESEVREAEERHEEVRHLFFPINLVPISIAP